MPKARNVTAKRAAAAVTIRPVRSSPSAVLVHPGGQFLFGLTQHEANDGREFSERSTGLDHLAFGWPTQMSSSAESDA
jgi:hypothetical protein